MAGQVEGWVPVALQHHASSFLIVKSWLAVFPVRRHVREAFPDRRHLVRIRSRAAGASFRELGD